MSAISIKTVDFCFSEGERLQFHFLCDRERSAVDRVISFMHGMNAVIADLEKFSDEDIEILKATKRFDGQSFFAAPNTCSNKNCVKKDRCASFQAQSSAMQPELRASPVGIEHRTTVHA